MDSTLFDPAYGRRREHRYTVELNAIVQVPTGAASGIYLKGTATIQNVSPSGLCVHIREMNEQHCARLPGAGQDCSVVCDVPDTEESVFLSGKVAWIDVHKAGPHSSARLGLYLTDTAGREHLRLLRFIERLAEKERTESGAEDR